MLLLPILFAKVVFVLGSFIMCSCLLIMYSSRYFPLLSVVVSCHDVDLALLSIAMIAPPLFASSSICSSKSSSSSRSACSNKSSSRSSSSSSLSSSSSSSSKEEEE